MIIRLFDIENKVVIPTEHCYTLKSLKDVIEAHPEDHLKIFEYVFYMTCPDPSMNPFFHYPEEDKEQAILKEIKAEFSVEDDVVVTALNFCKKLYETPTARAYWGIKSMLDRLATFMGTTPITTGRDGNGPFLLNAAKQYQEIRDSFKGAYKDLMDEQKTSTRGGANKAYDQ